MNRRDKASGAKYVAVKDHLSSDLGGETVILSFETGKYYGVNKVSHGIWEAVEEPKTLEDIVDHLMTSFEIEREVCLEQVSEFLEVLKSEGLIEELKP